MIPLTAAALEFLAARPINVSVAETEFMKICGCQPSL
jgi:hypothetical protein